MTGFNQKRIEYLSGVVLVLRDMFATKHFLAVHLKGPHLLALCPRRGERCAAVGSVRCPLNERIVHRLAAAGHLFQLESAGMSFLFFFTNISSVHCVARKIGSRAGRLSWQPAD